MQDKIKINEDAGRLFIYTPYELKDALKTALPSAKWDKVRKAWSTSTRSRKRVDAFVEMILSSGVVDEIAAKEEADLEMNEIEAIERELASVIEQNRAARDAALSSAERSERAETVRAHLAAAREGLEVVKADAEGKRAAADAAQKSLEAMLEGVVDFRAIRSDLDRLSRVAGVPKAYAREEREAIEARLMSQRRAARSVGVDLSGLWDAVLSMNFNKISRSHVSDAESRLLELSIYEPE